MNPPSIVSRASAPAAAPASASDKPLPRPENDDEDRGSGDARPRSDEPRVISLAHDFGVLRPGARAAHSFTIMNDTDVAWTVKDVTRTCNCTVVKISSNPIRPGETATVAVNYHAPSKYANQSRLLEIHFAEAASPLIQVEVRSSVRPPVVLTEQALRFAGSRKGYRGVRTLHVHNYSDANWSKIDTLSDVRWLSATASLLGERLSENGLRQVWELTVNADSATMQNGLSHARLTLHCDEEDAWLPVSLHLTGSVEPIPERMFFTSFDAAGRATCSVRLRCRGVPAAEVKDKLTLHHDLDNWLSLSVTQESGDFLVLKGELAVPRPVGAVKGLVYLDLHDNDDNDDTVIELPVSALR